MPLNRLTGPYHPYEKNHLFLHYRSRRLGLLCFLCQKDRNTVIDRFYHYELDHRQENDHR